MPLALDPGKRRFHSETGELYPMRDCIYITEADAGKLRHLIRSMRAASAANREHLEMLEEELDRAELVASDSIPRDVITMNSEVRLEDLDSGSTQRYTLVFPHQFRAEDSISVLAPIGTAMLGYRVGDVIEWPVPKGLRRLRVLEVIYQPEAERVRAGRA
jgi:regulator of nucleoside diphosphate kinase